MVRGLVLGALAFGAVFIGERQLSSVAKDVARYNAMREMSGDPPLLQQALKIAIAMISQLLAGPPDAAQRSGGKPKNVLGDMLAGVAQDVVRYASIRSM